MKVGKESDARKWDKKKVNAIYKGKRGEMELIQAYKFLKERR